MKDDKMKEQQQQQDMKKEEEPDQMKEDKEEKGDQMKEDKEEKDEKEEKEEESIANNIESDCCRVPLIIAFDSYHFSPLIPSPTSSSYNPLSPHFFPLFSSSSSSSLLPIPFLPSHLKHNLTTNQQTLSFLQTWMEIDEEKQAVRCEMKVDQLVPHLSVLFS